MEVLMFVLGCLIGFGYGISVAEIINYRYENIQRKKEKEIEKKWLDLLKSKWSEMSKKEGS